MAKVYNTEGEAMIVDESLQIHGGMGYSGDSEIETLYRNARSNRIYEGTSEINRMLTPTMLLRKAMKGELDLMGPGASAAQEVLKGEWPAFEDAGWKTELAMLDRLKKAAITLTGSAVQKFMMKLIDEQEVLMHLADIYMRVFAFESALLRSMKHDATAVHSVRKAMVSLLMHQAAGMCERAGTEIIHNLEGGAAEAAMLQGIRRCCILPPDNLVAMRRLVSDHFASQGTYQI